MDPVTILAGATAVGKAASLFGNFFGGPGYDQQKYNDDVARVARIDAKNQQIKGNDLKIFADYKIRGLKATEQLQNIGLEEDIIRGQARRNLDRATDDTLLANQNSFIKTSRRLTGPSSGRMNLDTSTLSQYGRGIASNLMKVSRGEDDFITQQSLTGLRAQNARARALAAIGAAPRNTPFITKYQPQDYSQGNRLADTLKLGSGLIGAAGDYMTTMEELDSKNIYEDLTDQLKSKFLST
jgi:hypothetical protein|tara:strand:+ start:66 stop:785 length:720 start_codon:yes stop_codon:yes gene_type:complete